MNFVRRAFTWIGILAGAIAFYLLCVALLPVFPKPRQPLPKGSRSAIGTVAETTSIRKDVRIAAGDEPGSSEAIHGWLYLPYEASAPAACVVMAHGLGGTVDAGLDAYARRFQDAGYAVLAFDYRHCGRSDGEPRQLIWIPTQLADWRTAIRYVRSREEIDGARIGLWGTSLSGGHAVAIASEDHAIACISVQCPGLDGHESAEIGFRRIGWGNALKLIIHGQRDLVRSWLRLSEHKIPIVGRSGSVALLAADEAWNAFGKLAPAAYVNEACARITIRGDKYRPVQKAQYVRCPSLLQVCEYDEFTSIKATEEAARRIGDLAEIRRYPIGHFDIYFGEHFETAVNDQLAFYAERL